ncbi:hypothetical protein C8Q80DRAFT_1268083 [Daedaleopsis nitida]|nr:hypothetical protein C8Q80DRAFT_1268083 [Daedaleopsis nitida]
MPSPQLVPASLPSPPSFPRRVSSRARLHLPSHPDQPPIPPRLVGSALLEKMTNPDPATLTPKIQKQLWFDGDEFGTRRTGGEQSDDDSASSASSEYTSAPSTPSSARRSHRRTSSIALAHRARSHSPPPPQQLTLSVPPVPPIPSSAFSSPGAKRSVLRTPPPTPARSRHPQIVIPDLTSYSGCPSQALRLSSRTRTSASPRRRALGCESH